MKNNKEVAKLKAQIQKNIDKVATSRPIDYLSLRTILKSYFQWEEGTIDQQEALADKEKELNSSIELLTQKYLSKNDWSKTAFLIIDMQEIYREQAEKMEIIPKIKKMIEICEKKKISIFWSQHGHQNPKNDGGQLEKWWGEEDLVMRETPRWKIMKEFIFDKEKGHIIKTKIYCDAFKGTELGTYLKSLGTKVVVIGGVLTNICCEDTARVAFGLNFEVIFLKDGTAASTKKMHNDSISNLDYGYAVTVTVDKVIKWVKDYKKTPKAKL